MKDNTPRQAHLTDDELYALALPPAGQPEALPEHLSACRSCSRALQEWKQAVSDLSQEAEDALAGRSNAEWEWRTRETMERVRGAGSPGRRGTRQAVVGLALAASMLLFAWLAPRTPAAGPVAPAVSAELSPADQEDDALLRDIQRVARGEEVWNPLAPEESDSDESL